MWKPEQFLKIENDMAAEAGEWLRNLDDTRVCSPKGPRTQIIGF